MSMQMNGGTDHNPPHPLLRFLKFSAEGGAHASGTPSGYRGLRFRSGERKPANAIDAGHICSLVPSRWVKQAPPPFHLAPALVTLAQRAADKRGVTLERWIGEAIWNALVNEHGPTCRHCGADNVGNCRRPVYELSSHMTTSPTSDRADRLRRSLRRLGYDLKPAEHHGHFHITHDGCSGCSRSAPPIRFGYGGRRVAFYPYTPLQNHFVWFAAA
jgi:hypothetical protein